MPATRWFFASMAFAILLPPFARAETATFVNKKTGATVTGELVDSVIKGGKSVYLVKTEDGELKDLLRSEWQKKSTSDPSPDVKTETPNKGGASMDVDFSGGKKPSPTGGVREVVATGAGVDPDKATQAAFSNAIEQVVGVLVDAETRVKNDQIVKDEILTYSKGFMQKFEVVKQWQQDGLHYSTIKASVETGKLTERLRANNIATRDVAGENVARQFRFDYRNEAEAAEMLKKILDKFDVTKVTKVEIVGEPKVTRDGANAVMHVTARVSPDMDKWGEYSSEIRSFLGVAAKGSAGFTMQRSNNAPWEDRLGKGLKNQLRGEGIVLAVFQGKNISGDRIQWSLFRIPETIGDSLKVTSAHRQCEVVFQLFTREGKQLAREAHELRVEGSIVAWPGTAIAKRHFFPLGQDVWWIGPAWWASRELSSWPARPVVDAHAEISLSQDDLAKVAKVAVQLERAGGNRESAE